MPTAWSVDRGSGAQAWAERERGEHEELWGGNLQPAENKGGGMRFVGPE